MSLAPVVMVAVQTVLGGSADAGVKVEIETYPGLVHGFLRATTMVRKARDAVARAGEWLQRVGA